MEVLPKEFAKLFQTSFKYLSCLWRNMKFYFKNKGFAPKYWRFLYTIPCVLVLHVILGISAAKFLAGGPIIEVANILPPFLICTQGILNFVILMPENNQLTTIIKELGDLWRTVGLNEVQINARDILLKKIRNLIGMMHWIIVAATSQFLLTPLLETLVRRQILKQDYKLVLPFEWDYPFGHTENWLVYGAVYAFQCYSTVLYISTYVGAEMLLVTLCALLAIEFTLLGEDILNVKPDSKKETEQTTNTEICNEVNREEICNIKDIVKRHQKLHILATQLDDSVNKVIFVNLTFGGITTCFFAYAAQYLSGPIYMVNNYAGVFGSLIIIFVFCSYGELLTSASLSCGDKAYHSIWYNGDKHYKKMILTIIMRSQKPCRLTSMKCTPVGLSMFTSVISTTWSYFSLMKSVYQE